MAASASAATGAGWFKITAAFRRSAAADSGRMQRSSMGDDVEELFLRVDKRVHSALKGLGHGVGLGAGDSKLAPGGLDNGLGVGGGVLQSFLVHGEGTRDGLFGHVSRGLASLGRGVGPILKSAGPGTALFHGKIDGCFLGVGVAADRTGGELGPGTRGIPGIFSALFFSRSTRS